MEEPTGPIATVHPGAVRVIFDHLVLALVADGGRGGPPSVPDFLFSHYTIRWSDDGQVGELAYVHYPSDGRVRREVLADSVAVAEAHRERLFPAAWPRDAVRRPPLVARFERSGLGSPVVRETVTSDGRSIIAEWSDLQPPVFAQGPAPAISTEDIMSTLIDARAGRAWVDGIQVDGSPFLNPAWKTWLGRPMTCVVAIGEILLTRP